MADTRRGGTLGRAAAPRRPRQEGLQPASDRPNRQDRATSRRRQAEADGPADCAETEPFEPQAVLAPEQRGYHRRDDRRLQEEELRGKVRRRECRVRIHSDK